MSRYIRPILQSGPGRPAGAFCLGGGWTWFTHVEVLSRDSDVRVASAQEMSEAEHAALTLPRSDVSSLSMDKPRVMGILNVTPDSFSDGGKHNTLETALEGARAMSGADILDIGGESTRPGAEVVAEHEEIERTAPVIEALRTSGVTTTLSIDTRKAEVAKAALDAGADLVNDVSGFTYDQRMAPLCASADAPVCIMHAQGDPATMQNDPHYENVLLDVYDFLAQRVEALIAQGVSKDRIIVDPGIGFGKTLEHNLTLLARLSLFHSLGVPLLLGASRKRFIGTISGEDVAARRMPGSLAVALAALKHGTQIVRVHDVPESVQAIALWRAAMAGHADG